jgi:benzoyl-CoA reductase subunit C
MERLMTTTPGDHEAPHGAGPAQLAERAEELMRDTSLATVRQWKERTGMPAVGFMPIYVPRELLHAQGVLPVGLMGAGDIEIVRGDAYYQSYICHIPRSTVELGLNGSLDCLDGMIFPAICDVIRNLSGMWTMMFPDKLVHYLDVPHEFSREIGGRFYRQDLEKLSSGLVDIGGLPLDDASLRASIRAWNANHGMVRRLYALRREEPWRVPTSELYVMLRAGLVLPVDEHTRMLEDYLEAVSCDETRTPMDQARVLLLGSFCEQPPLGLIKTIERAGCYIVDDDFVQVSRWLKGDVSVEGDPLDNLVNAFLEDSIDSPTRYVGEADKGEALIQRFEQSGAEGIVFCAPSFCDPALLDQPMAVAAVDRVGIPWTAFKYSENTGQFQVIREQAGTFADSIKLWSPA